MLTFGFYNSVNEDRKYNAKQMSSMFDGVINDGIFKDVGQAFNVSDGSGMQVVVGTGRAWFNHTWNYNELALLLTVEASELILDRIDTVVLEIDGSDEVRTNSLKIIKGTPGESPVAPTMVQNNPKYQYPLCDIYVAAEVSGLSEFNLTSRIGDNDCPYVISIIEASFPDNSLTTLKMATEQKRGVALGVASLDGGGQVPVAQLGNVPEGLSGTTANIDFYINAATGNDANDGLSSGTAFKTIMHAVNLIPKYLKHDVTLRVAAGSYGEYVLLYDYFGKGVFNMYITKPATINSLIVKSSSAAMYITKFDPDYVSVDNSLSVTLDDFDMGIREITFTNGARGFINNCNWSGAPKCIYANRNAYVSIAGNSGSGNTKVLDSNFGGTIVKIGAVGITGSVAETVSNGGVIR